MGSVQSARFEALQDKIRSYLKTFDMLEFRKAIEWVKNNPPKRGKTKTVELDGYFSDPITSTNTLVKYAKADEATIIASVLIPSIFPNNGAPVDPERLKDIEKKFGPKVLEIVNSTLGFMSLNLTRHASRDKDTVRDFRKMAIWAAEGPNPILIRAGHLVDNMQKEADKPGHFSAYMCERLLINADKVYADLTYISGHADLRKKIMNLSLQIQHRAAYEEICKIIDESKTRHNIAAIPDMVASLLETKLGWMRGRHFKVEYREKSPASAFAKAMKKKEEEIRDLPFHKAWPILRKVIEEDMGDIRALRILLDKPAIEDWVQANDTSDDSERSRKKNSRAYATLCERVYGIISREVGRGNYKTTQKRETFAGSGIFEDFSPVQEMFATFATTDPRDADKFRLENPKWYEKEKAYYSNIGDARFANYIRFPKPTGYESIHDLGCYIDPETAKLIRFEYHVVDVDRHRNNTEGPGAGHFNYKTGAAGNDEAGGSVENWHEMARLKAQGKKYNGLWGVYVLSADGNKIYNISRNPTVRGYLDISGINREFMKAGHEACHEVYVVDNRSVSPDVTRGPSSPLKNGVRVIPIEPDVS